MSLGDGDLALIQGVPLFAGLDAAALAALFSGTRATAHPNGTLLFSQDDPADRFFVLLSGWVKLYRLSEDGAEVIIGMMARGETFAEAAMFASGRFPVCAEAVSDIRVVALAASHVARTLQDHPAITWAILGSLSVRLRQLVQQVEQLSTRSAPQRVAAFLLRFCPPDAGGTGASAGGTGDGIAVDLPLQKALIARRLGMRPETLSRALAALEAVGVTRRDGGVTIASIGRLRRYCGPDGALLSPARAPCA